MFEIWKLMTETRKPNQIQKRKPLTIPREPPGHELRTLTRMKRAIHRNRNCLKKIVLVFNIKVSTELSRKVSKKPNHR